MMYIKPGYWLLLVGNLLTGITCLRAQGSWQNALNEMEQGTYDQAALSFEYLYFIEKEPDKRALSLLYKGHCQLMNSQEDEAGITYGRIKPAGLSDSMRVVVYTHTARYHLSRGDLDRAGLILFKWESYLQDRAITNEMLALELIYLLKNESWIEFDTLLNQQLHMKNQLSLIVQQTEEKKKRLKNEQTAATLSFILPGSGQVYAGRPLKGMVSLFFVSLSALYLTHSVIDQYYIASVGSGLPLTLRFYFGGKEYARELVRERNEQLKSEMTALILSRLSHNQELIDKEFHLY